MGGDEAKVLLLRLQYSRRGASKEDTVAYRGAEYDIVESQAGTQELRRVQNSAEWEDMESTNFNPEC